MDCTGAARREQICREYNVTAVGCYVLFDEQTIRSDAGGRIITDKYYLFTCICENPHREEVIKCGQPTARHLCELSGQTLPSEFNPFQGEYEGGGDGGGVNHGNAVHWHPSRRQLHNAIMLFITRYGERLQPNSPIFSIKENVERNIEEPVEARSVCGVNTIIGKFGTTMSEIMQYFSRFRPVRDFHFNILEQILQERGIDENNFI